MRIRIRRAALWALALATAACSDDGALNPRTPKFDGAPQLLVNTQTDGVRISEIHYDNTGTDAGEAIEVSAPATHDFFGWRIVLYNGSGGAQYDSDLIPIVGHTQCGTRKVAVVNYPSNGIQNGAPDGIALVDAAGTVVEFLSYEGPMTATNGPAVGLTSTDIGVSQNGTEPLGHSLQRTSSANTWVTSNPGDPGKFGECNDNGAPPPAPVVASVLVIPATATIDQGQTQSFGAIARDANGQTINNVAFTWSSSATAIATIHPTSGLATGVLAGAATILATAPNGVAGQATLNVNAPPPPPAMPAVRFSEIHYDNFGTDVGEAIELEGPSNTDLTGWSIVLYNGNDGAAYNTRLLSGSIDGTCTTLAGRGVAYFEYPGNGIQNGSPDGMALVDASGQVVEFLSYEGVVTATNGPAAGTTSTDIKALQNSAPVGQTLQRDQNNVWAAAASTIGGCNSGGPINRANIFAFSGRLSNDPPLPVGFEDQVFATLINPTTGDTIRTVTFTWSSDTPGIASVDSDGVVHALSAGNAVIRVTGSDGSTGTHTLATTVATAGAAQYGNHLEFGAPADMDNSDDFIVVRPQYISSFNRNTNIPNWAAYNLDQTHFGTQPRCDCFTYDPQLPASFTRYTTADYTGAGAAAGYGIDRGHLVRSFDREAGSLDNATTYYFSNIVPQAADNNQGPWGALETFLGNLALNGGSEVYIVAGASGSKGTVKNEGVITIPSAMWKVAIVMPRDKGLSDVDGYDDVTVYAVIMPNDAGIRNVAWQTYQTTVDAVEALSGYNLLALLPDHIEIAVESNTRPPVGKTDGPYTSNEGAQVSFSAAGSSDADGHALTYAWSFGDGATATGSSTTHTYAQDGSFDVQLVVTDVLGLADTVTTTATVANLAPAVAAFAGAVLLPGETYTAKGSFTDPGADTWGATVDYGDGSGVSPLALAGKTFMLAHTYLNAGTYTVTVTVQDDDASTPRTQTVTVLTQHAALRNIHQLVIDLQNAGRLNNGNANSLRVKLNAADASIERGDLATAINQLTAFLHELDAFLRSGRLSEEEAAPLRTEVTRVIRSID